MIRTFALKYAAKNPIACACTVITLSLEVGTLAMGLPTETTLSPAQVLFAEAAPLPEVNPKREASYVEVWCTAANGESEKRLIDKTRVDCLTDEYAIEFDFANKWKEAVGQSLHYARLTGKKPGIVLILRKAQDRLRYGPSLLALNEWAFHKDSRIRVWMISYVEQPEISHAEAPVQSCYMPKTYGTREFSILEDYDSHSPCFESTTLTQSSVD